jgi:hypothetical protein
LKYMKRILIIASLAAGLSLPLLLAPAAANATCRERRVAGTVVGGVGGALVGNALIGGPVGLIAGGLGGAVAGHEIAGAGCHTYARSAYNGSSRGYARNGQYPQNQSYNGRAPDGAPPVYYDQYGHQVGQGGTRVASAYPVSNGRACQSHMQSYYDSQGALRQQSVQDCAR